MRASYEKMAFALAGSKIELDDSDVINYVLSVVFTEADTFFESVDLDLDLSFEAVLNDVIPWLDPDSTLDSPAFITELDFNWEEAFDSYRALPHNSARWGVNGVIGESGPGVEGSIEDTLRKLLTAIPNPRDFFEDALDELFERTLEEEV